MRNGYLQHLANVVDKIGSDDVNAFIVLNKNKIVTGSIYSLKAIKRKQYY